VGFCPSSVFFNATESYKSLRQIYDVTKLDRPFAGSVNLSASRGSVLHDPAVHIIYYGHNPEEKKEVINTFVQNLGRSDWWKINTIYGDSRGRVPGSLQFKGSTAVVPGLKRSSVLDISTDLTAVSSIIQEAIDAGSVSLDTDGNTGEWVVLLYFL
jgi:hypothetical protein